MSLIFFSAHIVFGNNPQELQKQVFFCLAYIALAVRNRPRVVNTEMQRIDKDDTNPFKGTVAPD
jgi:hypothetical protein